MHEEILRRFNDQDPSHYDTVVRDEGDGTRKLKGGALRWDDDGCSVYRSRILLILGLPKDCIATDAHPAVARTSRALIESFTSGLADTAVRPEFAVVADPLEPGEPYDPAHTLIQPMAEYPSKTKRRTAANDLARSAFSLL
ncbi:hypothetical protein FBY40_1589 [Microbacterium sp. SLBN-154]|nr:hypothetical protein FBY40_1589 [Microbacterium sp. SLBN-154]